MYMIVHAVHIVHVVHVGLVEVELIQVQMLHRVGWVQVGIRTKLIYPPGSKINLNQS